MNFSDLIGNVIYFDNDDTTKNKRVQIDLSKMKQNVEEQDGDTKVYIDAIYVYR